LLKNFDQLNRMLKSTAMMMMSMSRS